MSFALAARAALAFAAALGLAAPAWAMPRAERPEDVGLSAERLARLWASQSLAAEVARARLAQDRIAHANFF